MTPTPIPEWFETWIRNWLRENVVTVQSDKEDIDITLDRHNAKTTWAWAIALAAYRLLSSQGLRWVKVEDELPEIRPKAYIVRYGEHGATGTLHERHFKKWGVTHWLYEPESHAPIQ